MKLNFVQRQTKALFQIFFVQRQTEALFKKKCVQSQTKPLHKSIDFFYNHVKNTKLQPKLLKTFFLRKFFVQKVITWYLN